MVRQAAAKVKVGKAPCQAEYENGDFQAGGGPLWSLLLLPTSTRTRATHTHTYTHIRLPLFGPHTSVVWLWPRQAGLFLFLFSSFPMGWSPSLRPGLPHALSPTPLCF